VAHEEIEIEISPEGKVTVTTKGIKGARCLDVAELLAQIVGREESRRLTSEYYETGVDVQKQQQIHQRYQ
jgi:Protein of unknown function (DUF2997)